MKEKNFVVLGLGRFGSTLANRLAENGYNVIAIDKDMDAIERVNKAVNCARGDCTSIEVLKSVGADQCDVGIVAIGTSLESSILGTMNLKELNIPYIISKAKDEKGASVLKKVGADKVILPEKDMAARISKMLMAERIVDVIDIDDDFSIVDIRCPESWVGKTLKTLDLRNRYGFNIIGHKSGNDPKMHANVGPNHTIVKNEVIVTIIAKDKLSVIDEIK